MIKDLLVPIAHTRGDDAAVDAGIALARSEQAHLTLLMGVSLPTPVGLEWAMIPGDLYAQLYDAERERAQNVSARLQPRLEASGVRYELRVVESALMSPPALAALHARYADLAIVASPRVEAPGSDDDLFVELLMDSGRSVLVVPPNHAFSAPVRRAVIAWQPTREATRAIHDSLPLLKHDASVDILMVDPVIAVNRHGEEPGADIAAHLARHGLRVRVVSRQGQGENPATVIQRHVVETGADLVIAGGYSHARLRQLVLGGVTRSLLGSCTVPILFGH